MSTCSNSEMKCSVTICLYLSSLLFTAFPFASSKKYSQITPPLQNPQHMDTLRGWILYFYVRCGFFNRQNLQFYLFTKPLGWKWASSLKMICEWNSDHCFSWSINKLSAFGVVSGFEFLNELNFVGKHVQTLFQNTMNSSWCDTLLLSISTNRFSGLAKTFLTYNPFVNFVQTSRRRPLYFWLSTDSVVSNLFTIFHTVAAVGAFRDPSVCKVFTRSQRRFH